MLGCGALDAGTPAAQSNATGLVATSATVDFGAVSVGTTAVRTNTITNNTSSPVILTGAQIDHADFSIAGQKLPLTLAPGQHAVLQIAYSPQSSGSSKSKVVLASNMVRLSTTFTLKGTATSAGRSSLSLTSISFGSVQVGQAQTKSATLSNSGTSPLTITRAAISGKGFTLTGLKLPVRLLSGQSVPVGVTFTPVSVGATSGTISLVGTLSLPISNRPVTFGGRGRQTRETTVALTTVSTTLSASVSGTGTGAGQLAVSPSSLALGSVKIGTSQTQSATLINSGSSNLTIRQATVTGSGFRMSGLSFPVTLAAGQRKGFTVTFTPEKAGSASGSIAVTTDDSNSVVNVPVSAVATSTAGLLSTSDSSLNFGSIQIGGTATQSETLTNTGGANVTITQAQVSGTGFSATGLSLPMTLSPGQSFTFGAAFHPTSGGSATGSISVVSDASDSTLTITLAGTAAVAGQLAVSPATLSFGSVTVGQSKTLNATLTATGSSITVSDASMTSSEFTISGLSLPLTLAAGKSVPFSVSFRPQSSGAASASGSFNSNAANSSVLQALSGTGAAAPQHSVTLSWNPSSSNVVGYNVYRGSTTGGPYSKINSMNASTSYVDSSVQAGQTYFYVTTAVDGSGKESGNSNQTQAVIPTP
jgi:HYDIN/CFA65/VesB-like, Ig-like domain/Abnormal spindle-like microcephaly-assoc'd, ASPM-SPD-2-Hydin/Cep192 domain 4